MSPQARAKVLSGAAPEFAREGEREIALALTRKAADLLPDDVETWRRLSYYLRLSRRLDEGYAVLEEFLSRHPETGEARQAIVRHALADRRLPLARSHVDRLLDHPDPEWRAKARSFDFDVSLEERAAARGTPAARRTSLWWMKTPYPGNFGDVLNPYIVEKVTGEPPRSVAAGKGMLAVGSVIKFARAGTEVWGTGTPRTTDELDPEARYHAVRGPLTRELVLRSGGTCPEVYGDPGLLLPRFYAPPSPPKRWEVGLVRHVGHRHVAVTTDPDAVAEISIVGCGYDDIERFVDAVRECEVVLSTSLHGLITAHAYGIPARWCVFGAEPGAIPGDGTKFADYFLSVGLPVQEPLDLDTLDVIDGSARRHVDPNVDLQFSAERLLDAFPR